MFSFLTSVFWVCLFLFSAQKDEYWRLYTTDGKRRRVFFRLDVAFSTLQNQCKLLFVLRWSLFGKHQFWDFNNFPVRKTVLVLKVILCPWNTENIALSFNKLHHFWLNCVRAVLMFFPLNQWNTVWKWTVICIHFSIHICFYSPSFYSYKHNGSVITAYCGRG